MVAAVNLNGPRVLGIAAVVLVLYGVIDAAIVQPLSAWRATGRSRPGWIALQIVLPPLASLVYVILVRRELARASR